LNWPFSVAPSIFATQAHASRSERYTYIPTIKVLDGLRKQGFEAFFVCQTRVRDEAKRDHTKHMLRLRHASQIDTENANEIILLNSHDGTSSYQMIAGMFRFVCKNGIVCGETVSDIRVPHKGDIVDNVIQGAFDMLEGFDLIQEQREGMQAVTLSVEEQEVLAESALSLKYDPQDEAPAPITPTQLLRARRSEDSGNDLWRVFNRVQENMIRGGLRARRANGRNMTTREVTGIDQNVKLNRALWILAERMRQVKQG